DGDPVVPVADDRLNDADLEPAAFEPIALFDMRFEITDVARWIELIARAAGEPRFGQGGAQRNAIAVFARVDLALRQRAGERTAAEHVTEMAFLIGPGDRFDPKRRERRVSGESARQFERVDDAERAIEPTAMRLCFAVRADEKAARGMPVAADDIADAVDDRVESRGGELLGEPVARGDVFLRIGRPMHAGLVAAEIGKPLQIGDDPFAIGLRHSMRSVARNLSAI